MIKKFYSPLLICVDSSNGKYTRVPFTKANTLIETINDAVQRDISSTFEDDDFACYFGDEYSSKEDKELRAKINKVTIAVEKHANKPMCVSYIDTSQKLTDDEWDSITDYITGQFSDGFGEGFEQHPCGQFEDKDLYVSFWTREGYFIRDTINPKK